MEAPFISLGSEQLSSALLQEVDVVQRLNDHWTCRIVLRDTPDRRPPVEDYAGKELKISTTELDGTETIVFHGLVRSMRLIYEITGAWGAELEAVSATWKMAQGTRLRYLRQQSAQAAAQAIVSGAGLQMGGSMPAGATLSYVQWDETDYSFFARLVDDTEAWFRPAVDGSGGLDVETTFQSGTTVNWREGEYGLLEWTTQGTLQPVTASGANYDPQKMQSIVVGGTSSTVAWYGGAAEQMVAAAQSASGNVESAWVDRHRAATLDDLTTRMQREARRGIANTVRCTGISRNPKVRAGDTLQVTGLPGVDATYGVIEVRHAWMTQGYENHFVVTPAQRWSPPARPARPLLDGVYPARVVDNHDPHNQGRIRVQYYWQEDGQSTWVRLLTPHAGSGRGTLFLPELGDEVLVTFEEGDSERPYVVGSAWNGVHQPPATGFHSPGEVNGSEFAKNNIKRIVTKSGHRITLVDTPGKETISIATPTSNRLMLTESHADTGGRPAIVLESAGDIVMAAPNGRIHTQSMYHSREVGIKDAQSMQVAQTVPARHTAATPLPAAPKKAASEGKSDGALIGKSCRPVATKEKASDHYSPEQVKSAWGDSMSASSPCCDRLRSQGKAPGKIVYTNGIKTDVSTQCKTMQEIAKRTCAQVLGVHNATAGAGADIAQTGLKDKAGIFKEDATGKVQSAAEKLGIGPTRIQPKAVPPPTSLDPATTSLSDVMLDSYKSKDNVLYIDHSQGGAITSKAAYSVTNAIAPTGQVPQFKVIDFAGAAQKWPESVTGEHYINMKDLTPQYVGLGANPLSDAQNIGKNQTMVPFIGEPGSKAPQFLSPAQALDYMKQRRNLPAVSPSAYHDVDTTYLNAYAAKHPDATCE